MAKPLDSHPSNQAGAGEPATPGPEITIEPARPRDAAVPELLVGEETPMPEVILGDETPPPDFFTAAPTPPPVPAGAVAPSRESSMERLPTPKPLPAAWAAQPLSPMQDEATVPLPVEEVEFATAEGEFGDGRAQLRTGDVTPSIEPARASPPVMPSRPPVLPTGDTGRPQASEALGRPTPPPAPLSETVKARPTAPTAAPAATPPPMPAAASTGAPLLPPGATWQEALSQRPRKKRLKPWFEEAFDEDYLRTLPFLTPEQTLREVEFLKDSFKLPRDAELLDVGCGYGRHAIELGQGGYRVTGIDLSLPLLIRAADEAQRRALSVNFIHADMREMAFDAQFDGAYSFLTSFGYFDEETNLKVASSIFRALKPGGRFLLDLLNRDYIVTDLPTRVWWEGEGCVVLEEVDFNYQTSRLMVRRSVVFQDGRQAEHEMSIRAYSLHEVGKLLRQAGFRILEVSGGIATRGNFFGAASRNVMVLSERPAD
ncbi:MAG TPA: methyltransferase domain-containing protein [Polyangia bacterium]